MDGTSCAIRSVFSEEKKLSIAALLEIIADRLIEQVTPLSASAAGTAHMAPGGKRVLVIIDNYAAHKHANLGETFQRHLRFTFHFTPISCS